MCVKPGALYRTREVLLHYCLVRNVRGDLLENDVVASGAVLESGSACWLACCVIACCRFLAGALRFCGMSFLPRGSVCGGVIFVVVFEARSRTHSERNPYNSPPPSGVSVTQGT